MLPLLILGVVVIILAVGGAMLINKLVATTDARYHALSERVQRIEARLLREENEPRA